MIVPSSNLFHLAYGKYANCCLQRQQHGADLGLVQRLYRVSSSLYHLAVERPTEILDDSLTTVSGALTCSERLPAFESAGPRRRIFFDPAKTFLCDRKPVEDCARVLTTSYAASQCKRT